MTVEAETHKRMSIVPETSCPPESPRRRAGPALRVPSRGIKKGLDWLSNSIFAMAATEEIDIAQTDFA